MLLDLKNYNLSISSRKITKNYYNSLNIYINKCTNSTNIKKNCLPDYEINKKLLDIKLTMKFYESRVDTKNYYDPFGDSEAGNKN